MKLSRTAGISAAAAVLVAAGLTAGFIAGGHSGDADQPTAGATPGPVANGPATTGAPDPSSTPSASTPVPSSPASTAPGTGPRVQITNASAPALTPAQLTYQQQSWGDPKTEVGVVMLAPKAWSMVKLSTFEVRFTSPNKLWTMRVNANASDLPVKTLADRQLTHTGSSTRDFQLVSRDDGSTNATNPNFAGVVFHHTTFTYSYTDPARGTRLVIDRFVSLDDIPHTLFEISTAGRPQDATALAAITAKATEDFIRLP